MKGQVERETALSQWCPLLEGAMVTLVSKLTNG